MIYTWSNANFGWSSSFYSWNEVELVKQLIGGAGEDFNQWNRKKK